MAALTILLITSRKIVNLKTDQIPDSAKGHFLRKKCAIDRRLSTECSLKLRLWRLFDPHEYTRVCSVSE